MAKEQQLPLRQDRSLRDQAVGLRRSGRSRREIQATLRVRSNRALTEMLRGEPPPAWTKRPNAKDELRRRACELRAQGRAYREIAATLGVSKSSVSLWLRDIPQPDRLTYEEVRARQAAGTARYWAGERQRREQMRVAISADAAKQIGSLSEREVRIAGAVAYWCEGAKNKPHRRSDHVDFINSDPALIRLFLRFLDRAGVTEDRLIFQVSIHESADVVAAQEFWLEVTQTDPAQFRRPQIKRHNPRTNRKNTGDTYHGCLRVRVRRSSGLYRQIEGWALGCMSAPPLASGTEARLEPTQRESVLPGEDSNLG
ncbi:MAG TPA: hypothetical protein VF843_08635 [Streptosporangiaceae bacterium]